MNNAILNISMINKKNIFVVVLSTIIAFSLNLHYIFGNWYFYLPIMGVVGIILLCLIIKNKSINKFLLLFLIQLLFMFIYSIVFSQNPIGVLYSIISCILVVSGYWMAKQSQKYVMHSALMALIFYFLFFIFSGVKYGFNPDAVNYYLVDASRNIVSTIVIFMQLLYSMSYFNYTKKLPIVTSLITLLICILSFGRTGVVLGFLIFLLSVYSNILNKSLVFKTSILGLIMFIISILGYYQSVIFDIVVSKTNFEQGLDSPRTVMREEYLNQLNWSSILTGVDLSTLPSVVAFGINPHNSFIYGHYLFGVLYLFYMLSLFWFLIMFLFQIKNKIIPITLLLIYLIKAFFDKVALLDVGDVVFYFILFSIYFQSIENRRG